MSQIDCKFNQLIKNIDDKYSKSHPNIGKIWREYLIKKNNNMLKDIELCNSIFDNLINNEINDIEPMTILTLTALFNN